MKQKPQPNEVILSTAVSDKRYANPHRLDVSKGKSVLFTVDKDEESGFEILIHNKDRFFDTDNSILYYFIMPGKTIGTPKVIGTSKEEEDKKYYIAYSMNNKDYSDGPDTSPPKIVGM